MVKGNNSLPPYEKFYFSKWVSFSAGCLVMLQAGLAYIFSLYSDAIKTYFGYSQTEIDSIGAACDFGGYLHIFPGLFYDFFKPHDRVVAPLTILVGSLLHMGGYTAMWAASSGRVPVQHWHMLIIGLVACNGQTWMETAALVTAARNFETDRGTVIGILKSFLGLSASFYTTVYVGFITPDAIHMILVLALAPGIIAISLGWLINYVPWVQIEPHTKSHAYHLAFTAVIGLAAYFGEVAIIRSLIDLDGYEGILIITAVGLLFLPIIAIPFIFGGIRSYPLKSELAQQEKEQRLLMAGPQVPPEVKPLLEKNESSLTKSDDTAASDERNLAPWQTVRNIDFICLWLTNVVGSGAGLTFLNNVPQMVIALGGEAGGASVFVSLYSVANGIGRLTIGIFPDYWQKNHGIPRTTWVVVMSIMTLGVSFLNAFAGLDLLILTALLSGYAFGAFQGLMPAITSEICGLKYLASNYGIMQLSPAIGGFALATGLSGTIYDQAVRRQQVGEEEGGEEICRGAECFRLTFIIVGICAAVTSCLAMLLWYRTRAMYTRIADKQQAEARKRGLQAEFEEGREIMQELLVNENKLLEGMVLRGKALAEDLHVSLKTMPPGWEEANPLMQQVVSELGGLVLEVNSMVQTHEGLKNKYENLPTLRRTMGTMKRQEP